jgi:hypothetical protein
VRVLSLLAGGGSADLLFEGWETDSLFRYLKTHPEVTGDLVDAGGAGETPAPLSFP